MDHERHEKLLYPDEVFGIQGAVFAVYATLGPGFLEGVYQECLAIEFEARGHSLRCPALLAAELSRTAASPQLRCRLRLL